MMQQDKRAILLAGMISVVTIGTADGAPLVEDLYNVGGNGTGFALNMGVNSGINPPATRLTGTAAANLRYLSTGTKAASAFSIAANKLRVTAAANPGRFVLSANGSTSFDFGSVLGVGAASPAQPAVYELTISMANSSVGVQRFSFALGTAEGDANTWGFGIQLYRNDAAANFYTIGKRIDTAASGLGADLNTFITNTAPGTYGTEISLLMRITDAGAETTTFNSRVQLSMDGGFTWFYDTQTDPDLPQGWRLNGAARHIMWDVAPGAGDVTYDNFSVRALPVAATLVSPPDKSPELGASVTLTAVVSNRSPGNVTATFYGRVAPRPFPGSDFCIAVLPDTQNYAREAAGNGDAVKEMWFTQTEWIVTNRVAQNIVYVAQLGDCVQNGDVKNGNPNLTEWRNATNAMYRLENPLRTLRTHGVPYGIAVGNHDQEPMGDPDGGTQFYNLYFGAAHFNDRDYYGGHYGSNNDNHFDRFSAGGLDFIVLYFEFGRYGTAVLNWANAVLATNQHRFAIAVTHYAGSDTTPSNLSPAGSAIYNALRVHPKFFLLLGGHVFNNNGEGSRSNTYEGRTVRTFISNYQGRMNGGNGLMRLMYFSPSNNVVNIKTYSPWLNQFETDANSQMSFNFNLQLPSGPGSPGSPYVALATNVGVVPGALTSCIWTGLQAKTTYDWYVKVEDAAGNSAISASRQFATQAKFAANTAPVASNQFVTVTGDEATPLTFTASDADADALTFQIVSQPLNGLTADFDPDSGQVTYRPARSYRGPDRIIFIVTDGITNSPPATLNLNVMPPLDTNANGLADAWETTYGITDPGADADGDGQNNQMEYQANTTPTNAASVLRVVEASQEATGEFGFVWSSVGGTRYRVQYAEAGGVGAPMGPFVDVQRFIADEMDPAPYGEPSTQSYTDLSAPAGGVRLYRVRVVP